MKRTFALFTLLSAAVFAQDEVEKPGPKTLLTDAILHFRGADVRVASADIKHARPGGGGMFGGMQIQIGFGGAQKGSPFEGKVEAWRGRDGVTVIVSEERLPGFKLYIDGQKRIQEATFEKHPANLSQLQYELASLLDTDHMVKQMLRAQGAGKLKTSVDVDTGDVTFSGPIDTEIVTPVDAASNVPAGVPLEVADKMFPRHRILEAEATFVVTKAGQFKSIAIKVTRNDPGQEMMRKMRKGGAGFIVLGNPKKAKGGQGGQGGGAPPPPAPPAPPAPDKKAEKDKKNAPIVGGSTTYTLTFGERPSETAQAFKKKIARAVGG